MAFIHGKGTAALYNEHDLSSYFNDGAASHSVETAETTVFGNDDKTYIVGLRDGTVSLSGMFDGSTDAVDDVLRQSLGTEDGGITTICYGGATAGNRASLAQVETTSYDISMPVSDVVAASAEFQVDGGLRHGFALVDLASLSADGQSTGVDYTAGATGWTAHLHVTANTFTDVLDVKLQDSTDNAVWADLTGGAFTQVAASTTTSEKISGAGAYNRYVRIDYNFGTGTGAATILVAFATN